MTDTLHCTRGCIRWDRHLSDCDATDDNPCKGCEPRPVETGWLCSRCLDRLATLLGTPDDRESIAGCCLWLADNLGQHIRHSMGGKPSGDGSTHGEGMVSVMAAMSDLQVAFVEMAQEFTETRSMRLGTDHDPAAVAARLRPWLTTLADWEPIGDQIDHLQMLIGQAHGIAPWRGKDPNGGDRAAVVLWGAPVETTDQICSRFGLVPKWLYNARQRKGLEPDNANVKPLSWRPWDVFAILHPADARRHEARLAQVSASRGNDVVWSSEDEPVSA